MASRSDDGIETSPEIKGILQRAHSHYSSTLDWDHGIIAVSNVVRRIINKVSTKVCKDIEDMGLLSFIGRHTWDSSRTLIEVSNSCPYYMAIVLSFADSVASAADMCDSYALYSAQHRLRVARTWAELGRLDLLKDLLFLGGTSSLNSEIPLTGLFARQMSIDTRFPVLDTYMQAILLSGACCGPHDSAIEIVHYLATLLKYPCMEAGMVRAAARVANLDLLEYLLDHRGGWADTSSWADMADDQFLMHALEGCAEARLPDAYNKVYPWLKAHLYRPKSRFAPASCTFPSRLLDSSPISTALACGNVGFIENCLLRDWEGVHLSLDMFAPAVEAGLTHVLQWATPYVPRRRHGRKIHWNAEKLEQLVFHFCADDVARCDMRYPCVLEWMHRDLGYTMGKLFPAPKEIKTKKDNDEEDEWTDDDDDESEYSDDGVNFHSDSEEDSEIETSHTPAFLGRCGLKLQPGLAAFEVYKWSLDYLKKQVSDYTEEVLDMGPEHRFFRAVVVGACSLMDREIDAGAGSGVVKLHPVLSRWLTRHFTVDVDLGDEVQKNLGESTIDIYHESEGLIERRTAFLDAQLVKWWDHRASIDLHADRSDALQIATQLDPAVGVVGMSPLRPVSADIIRAITLGRLGGPDASAPVDGGDDAMGDDIIDLEDYAEEAFVGDGLLSNFFAMAARDAGTRKVRVNVVMDEHFRMLHDALRRGVSGAANLICENNLSLPRYSVMQFFRARDRWFDRLCQAAMQSGDGGVMAEFVSMAEQLSLNLTWSSEMHKATIWTGSPDVLSYARFGMDLVPHRSAALVRTVALLDNNLEPWGRLAPKKHLPLLRVASGGEDLVFDDLIANVDHLQTGWDLQTTKAIVDEFFERAPVVTNSASLSSFRHQKLTDLRALMAYTVRNPLAFKWALQYVLSLHTCPRALHGGGGLAFDVVEDIAREILLGILMNLHEQLPSLCAWVEVMSPEMVFVEEDDLVAAESHMRMTESEVSTFLSSMHLLKLVPEYGRDLRKMAVRLFAR